jgi:hypothetical protein
MIPITGFSSLTSPEVKYKDIFPNSNEVVSEIQAVKNENSYRYTFLNNNANLFWITIKEKENAFELSAQQNGDNKVELFEIQDLAMREFQQKCKNLRLSFGYSFVGAVIVSFVIVIGVGALECAGVIGLSCLQEKNMTELLKKCCAVAAAIAVLIGSVFYVNNSEKGVNEDNNNLRKELQTTILNKHLTVIQAYNQNTQVTENQLLTFVKV